MSIYQMARCLSEWRSTPSTISRNGWSSTETMSLESTSPFFEEAFHGCQAQSREQSQRAAAGKTEVAGGGWWAWWPPPNDWYGNSEGWNAFEITDLGCHIHSIRFHPFDEKGYLTHLSPWLVPRNFAGRRAISTESDSVQLSFSFLKSCGLYPLVMST